MNVFISWSGDKSFTLANALRRWLKLIVQSIEPWVSSKDIVAGQRWGYVLGKQLADARVVPLLLGLTAESLSGPLAQFQSLPVDRDGIRTLVESLHRAAETKVSEQEVATLFDALWPQLQREIEEIPSQSEEGDLPRRTEREILDELVTLVRGLKVVTPDDREISRALKMLAENIRGDLEYTRKSEKAATTASQGSTTYDFCTEERERDLRRVEAATRVLETRGQGVEASMVRIVGFKDLAVAINELWGDLSYREYQMERYGDDNPSLRGIRKEMTWIEEIQNLIHKLEKESSDS